MKKISSIGFFPNGYIFSLAELVLSLNFSKSLKPKQVNSFLYSYKKYSSWTEMKGLGDWTGNFFLFGLENKKRYYYD